MASCQRRNFFKFLFILTIFLAYLQLLAATRPLSEEYKQGWKQEGLVLQSLQKGSGTPSGPNPCSYIPGQGSGTCKLSEMNIAGNVVATRASPAASDPNTVMDVAVASVANENQDNNQDFLSSAS